jgi:hypothetical protein
MAEIRQDLKLQSDPSTIVRPNIVTDNIPDGGVTTAKINDGAGTTAKIADNAITSAKIASGAVVNDKLSNNVVTSSKIADGAVQAAKISSGAVLESKLADNAVSHDKLKNYSVYGNKISRTAGLIVDHDWGETFSDFVTWLKDAFASGATFFYSDGSDCASCYIRVTDSQIDIVLPLPLTGYQSSYTVTSANFETWLASEGSDIYACFIN